VTPAPSPRSGRWVRSSWIAVLALLCIGGAGTVAASALPSAGAPPEPTAPTTTTADGRGTELGSTAFPVPPDALFVDVRSGYDGAPGTRERPLRTVRTAIERAGTGGTVVLREGVYHESVVVPPSKTLAIQAHPGETVWFDGSVTVRGWDRTGDRWVAGGWTAEFGSEIDGVADNPDYVDPGFPLAARPDQLFLDGAALTQVAAPADVVPGTFAVDRAADALVIGDDPSGREVRASDLERALFVRSPGSTLQGFGVRRYATPVAVGGAVKFENRRSTARDLVVVDNAAIGLSINNDGGLVERVTVQRSGMLGIGSNAGYGLVIRGSLVTGNNAEHFRAAPVSGGIKITRARGVTVADNDVSRNYGSGIWLDESVYDATVVHNVATDNEYTGIQVELCAEVVVADNVLTGQRAGLNVFGSSGVRVWNNAFGGNSRYGVRIQQDERRQAVDGFAGRDPQRPVPDPTMTWVVDDVTVADNVFGPARGFHVWALDTGTGIPADDMGITVDGNVFAAPDGSRDAVLVGWGRDDGRTVDRYATPQELAAATEPGWRNALAPAGTAPDRVVADAARSVARPLPDDVARAVGRPAGTRTVGPFP
jgi:parallel beta-helix repeat protein